MSAVELNPVYCVHALGFEEQGNVTLPPLLTPLRAFLEYDVSETSRRMSTLRQAYINDFRNDRRIYPRETVINYLHLNQIDTKFLALVSSVYDGIGDVVSANGQGNFLSPGGENRRLQLMDIVHRDAEHPYVIRAFARELLAVPPGGVSDSPYEQHARRIIERLSHPYNADIKVPVPVESMPMVEQSIEDRIALFLEKSIVSYSVIPQNGEITFFIPEWSRFWQAPRIDAEIPVNVLQLRWAQRSLIFHPSLRDVAGYAIRINSNHRPDINPDWQSVYVRAGIVNPDGEFIHYNFEGSVSPLATRENGLTRLDERSGPFVSDFQNTGATFNVREKTVTVPSLELYQFVDVLPVTLPEDINKLLGLLNRQIQYYALTFEQNDQRLLVKNAQALVRAIVTINNQKDISPEKAEQAMQTMALAFLQAPNGTLEFFRASGLSTIFPRAVRLDTKERMTSLDRTDMCFPTTEVDPETGIINWNIHELGLYMAVVHATGDSYPTMKTKRSIAAEFCWLFDPRAVGY